MDISPSDSHLINILLDIKKSKPITKFKTLTILDWDDTLFPTTYIARENNISMVYDTTLVPDIIKRYFLELSNCIKLIITIAKEFGEVVIITNALPSWIDACCNLMPSLRSFLKTVNIIYARVDWEKVNSLPEKWKEFAFLNKVINTIGTDSINSTILNLICVGDSIHEHDAARLSADKINSTSNNIVYVKNIIFLETPRFSEILYQLHVLKQYYYSLTELNANTYKYASEKLYIKKPTHKFLTILPSNSKIALKEDSNI